jgi:hypothetical protein
LNNSLRAAGGGGAGGVLSGTLAIEDGTYPVTVGAGGQGGAEGDRGGQGGDSSVFDLVAIGGGGGGSNRDGVGLSVGTDGGSGGGSFNNETTNSGSGTAGQGFDGSAGDGGTKGGGGGGAGGAGAFGLGGAGVTSSITGTSEVYATGGDGGDYTLGNLTGVSGAADTGNGGSGASRSQFESGFDFSGGDGGSGVVILRYPGAEERIFSEHDVVSVVTVDGMDHVVHRFTLDSTNEGVGSLDVVADPVSPRLEGFRFDPATGDAEVRIQGRPGATYILVEAADLDFAQPDRNPVPLSGATVGTLGTDQVTTDGDGNATVQFNLGTGNAANFIRGEEVSP